MCRPNRIGLVAHPSLPTKETSNGERQRKEIRSAWHSGSSDPKFISGVLTWPLDLNRRIGAGHVVV